MFDVHDDGPALWGDDSLECEGREDIERITRRLLDEAHARQGDRDSVEGTTTVMVMNETGGVVLNARAERDGVVRLIWAPG